MSGNTCEPPVPTAVGVPPAMAPERPRFWSEADCKDLLRRLERVTSGGGVTTVAVWSSWTGYARWARNLVSGAGEVRNNVVRVDRSINGAQSGMLFVNDTSDAGLEAAARRAEREAKRSVEQAGGGAEREQQFPYPLEPLAGREYFSQATYQLDDEARATAAQRLAQVAAGKGMLSAGYVQVSARSMAMLDTLGHVRYVPFTQAQYSVTVRNPQGTGSGWAGDSAWDWAKLDPDKLTQTALDKCVKSQDPVRVEPGRYTAILEPQAVADLVAQLVCGPPRRQSDYTDSSMGRDSNEWDDMSTSAGPGPFTKVLGPDKVGYARLGERVADPRLTLSTDPMDPELGYPAFGWDAWGGVTDAMTYRPVTWIKDGVLTTLSYTRRWAAQWLKEAVGLPNPGGFRLSVAGPTSTVDDMVSSTKRGLLVTRFDQVQLLDLRSTLCRGYTRDGLWLVEDGKVTKPVKNMQFVETVLGKLNSVEQAGAPVRAFHPTLNDVGGFPEPVIVPALKVTDFSFNALSDAV